MVGEGAEWGLSEQLLAAVFDQLAVLAWLNSANGQKGINRPKPLPRPGVTPPSDEKRFGSHSVPLDEMAAWLAARNPHQVPPSLN